MDTWRQTTKRRFALVVVAVLLALLIPYRVAFAEHAKGQVIVVFERGAHSTLASSDQAASDKKESDIPTVEDQAKEEARNADEEPLLEEGVDEEQRPQLRTQTNSSISVGTELEELGFEITAKLDEHDGKEAVLCEVPQGITVEEAIAQVEDLPGVQHVQPNYLYHIIEPSLFDSIKSNYAVSASQQKNLVAAHIPSAWSEANVKTNATVSVAVIDTGCRFTHEDLVSNVDVDHAWDYWNGTDGVGQKLTSGSVSKNGDDNGHGTHVCGIIAAEAENNVGMNGASYNAKIIPIKVANSAGGAYTSDIVLAIGYAKELRQGSVPNLRVINISMGGDNYDEALEGAVDEATEAGILVVCSAGNESSAAELYPSDYNSAFSVMALDEEEAFASYTSYNEHKDIAAVGTAFSTYNDADDDYATLIGTSMSAPLVSGVASLVWSVNPAMSVDQVRSILLETTQEVTNTNGANLYEHLYENGIDKRVGQINAYAAVTQAQNTFGTGASVKKVAPPSVTNFDYNGKEHVGVPDGAGYSLKMDGEPLEGSSRATEAGTYVVTATLDDGYSWVGLDGDEAYANIELTWSIAKAPLKAIYVTQTVTPNTPWEEVQNSIRFSGFAGGQGEADVFPNGENMPFVTMPEDYDTYKADIGHSWELVPQATELANYEMECVAGRLIVSEDSSILRKVPTAKTSFVYDGVEHQAVSDGDWYDLQGDVRKTAACSIKTNDGVPITGPNRYELYETTIHLKNQTDYWSDGTQADKVVRWKITKRPLSLVYEESWILKGGSIPQNIKIEGFIEGERSAILDGESSGFKLPCLRWRNMDYGNDGVRLTSDVERTIVGTKGDYTLIPDPFREDGNDYNATSNYEFTSFTSGVLHVCDSVRVPTGASLTYNGTAQRGVANGTGYVVGGVVMAANAGTYTSYVTPAAGYMWPDGTRNRREVTWRIARAPLSTTTVAGIADQTYTGSSLVPKLTVRLGSKTLREGIDYTPTYKNNVNVGVSSVTITGKGNLVGTRSATFRIRQADVARASVADIPVQPYSGKAVRPTPTVTMGGKTLRLGTDYTLAYANNVSSGTATITIVGKGNYMGTKKTTFRIVAPNVSYRTHVQNIGWQGWKSDGVMNGTSGRSLRLEGIYIKLTNTPVSGSIRYRTHIQNIGWQGWRNNGTMSGTSGRSLRLEAIQIQLTGEMGRRYDVWYRVHAQNVGWMGWASNGAQAGTAGYSRRLEALQVVLVPKGAGRPATNYRGIRQNNWRPFIKR